MIIKNFKIINVLHMRYLLLGAFQSLFHHEHHSVTNDETRKPLSVYSCLTSIKQIVTKQCSKILFRCSNLRNTVCGVSVLLNI